MARRRPSRNGHHTNGHAGANGHGHSQGEVVPVPPQTPVPDPTPTPPPTEGIGGQPIVDDRTGAKDMRLLRRAVREGWPVTPEIRLAVVEEMDRMVRDGKGRKIGPREKIAAARVLTTADSINVRRKLRARPRPDDAPLPGQVNVQVGGVQLNADLSKLNHEQLLQLRNLLAEAAPAPDAAAGPVAEPGAS